jgi:hypothetical protein
VELLYSIVQLFLVALAGIIMAILTYVAVLFLSALPRRPKEPGFEYVYVNDDGGTRELDEDERAYLMTKFHPADGNRPYIKSKYSAQTPDGKLRGYLRRRQLPKRIRVDPAPEQKETFSPKSIRKPLT